MGVAPATAAEQLDDTDDGSTTALTAGNSARFNGAIGTDEVFTGGDGVNVGDTGVVVSGSTTDGVGTLTFSGDSTATGTIGDTANRLGILNAGVAGKAVTITENVFAVTSNVSGTGTINFQGNLTGNLDYDAAGTATFATGKNLTGTVTNSSGAAAGTLTLSGTTTVSGQVGAAGNSALSVVNGGANGATATFSSDVFATTLNVTGTVNLDGAFTGVLDFDAAGTTTIATTKNLTGSVTNSSGAAAGTLTIEGTTTVSGQVGAAGTGALSVVNGGANGTTATFSSDVFATTLNVTGTGTVNLDGDFTGTLDFDAAGTATVATGKNIDTVTNSSGGAAGTLTFEGTTTTGGTIGSISTAAQQLGVVNFNGGTASVGNDIGATTISIANGATVTYTANATYASDLTVGGGASGTLNLGANTLTGSATGAGSGDFTMASGATLGTTISSATVAGNLTTPGTVTIAAATTINITVTATDYITTGTTYTIVDGAAGAPNVPTTITDNSSVLSFAGSISGNDLILTATRNVTYSTSVSSGSSASGAATVLTAISESAPTGDIATVLAALDNLSGTAQATAITTTTPEVSGGGTAASFSAQGQTLGTVSARLGDLRASLDDDQMTGFATGNRAKGVGIWLRGFGSHSSQRKRLGIDGYKADSYGIATGGDKRLLEDRLTLGLAYTYVGSDIDSTGDREEAEPRWGAIR